MTPEEIDRWDPAQIGEVFRVCQARQQACTDTADKLKSPELFATWKGEAADAARESAGRQRVDLDSHGTEAQQVAKAAAHAQTEVEDVKKRLQVARSGFYVIDDATGKVSYPPTFVQTLNVYEVEGLNTMQRTVNAIMADADDADRDLALAIQAATGEIPPDAANAATQPLPHPESRDHLPGEHYPTPGPILTSPGGSTATTRVFKNIPVPKGWKDPEMRSDLAKLYGARVTIDPASKGAQGSYSADLLPKNPITNKGVGIPGIPKESGKGESSKGGGIDIGLTQQKALRVVGAHPTAVRSVEIDGVSYLAVDYQYEYETDDLKIANVDSVRLPDSGPDWRPISLEEVQHLGAKGVPLPDPGKYN